MDLTDVNLVLERSILDFKNSWEQTRQICFVIAKMGGSKAKKPEAILKFSWDNKTEVIEKKPVVKMDQSRIEELKNTFSDSKSSTNWVKI